MKKICLILVIFASLSLFSNEEDTLFLSIADYPPYEMIIDGKPAGIAVEIVETVFKRMGQKIDFKLLPWSRALHLLKLGELDGTLEVFKTNKRLEFLDFSNEILLNETTSLFVLEDSEITFDGDLAKLKGFMFGIRQDFSYGEIFDSALENKIITKYVKQIYNENRLFYLLNNNKIDIYIGDKYGTFYQYKLAGLDKKIVRLSPDVQSTPTYMVFSKKNNLKHIRDKFDTILKEMKEDGTYNRILKEWENIR